ncbi:hypothetical protein KIN20_012072 [Parelaphostrongylus tenuis]|uniref:Uncharacterized protein n=1 Tax=Parelaphostrongylus tenuis TaxID=148309 RepID=A0AAD5MDW4_PARTN|nr:hypothetical protein KIN20_012072 [Parelaphostrongylus tenuis]
MKHLSDTCTYVCDDCRCRTERAHCPFNKADQYRVIQAQRIMLVAESKIFCLVEVDILCVSADDEEHN